MVFLIGLVIGFVGGIIVQKYYAARVEAKAKAELVDVSKRI